MKEIYVKSPARFSLSTEQYVSKVSIKFVDVNLVSEISQNYHSHIEGPDKIF